MKTYIFWIILIKRRSIENGNKVYCKDAMYNICAILVHTAELTIFYRCVIMSLNGKIWHELLYSFLWANLYFYFYVSINGRTWKANRYLYKNSLCVSWNIIELIKARECVSCHVNTNITCIFVKWFEWLLIDNNYCE